MGGLDKNNGCKLKQNKTTIKKIWGGESSLHNFDVHERKPPDRVYEGGPHRAGVHICEST
jgi:hypothetical protein